MMYCKNMGSFQISLNRNSMLSGMKGNKIQANRGQCQNNLGNIAVWMSSVYPKYI